MVCGSHSRRHNSDSEHGSVSINSATLAPKHYQKNIEVICSNEAEVREQVRLMVIHELGHYFGMDENQLKDV